MLWSNDSTNAPVRWDLTSLNQVEYTQIPVQLDQSDYRHFEQWRLEKILDRPQIFNPTNSQQSKTDILNDMLIRAHKQLSQVAKYTTIKFTNHLFPKCKLPDAIQLIVRFFNYLVDKKGVYRFDPTSSTFVSLSQVKVPIYTLMMDPNNLLPDILTSFDIVINLSSNSELDYNLISVQVNRLELPSQSGGTVSKCLSDLDCPYYQANRNYPNNFGGCDRLTGVCQLPIGTSRWTARAPLDPWNAHCGNCRLFESPTCCESQKTKTHYPRIASPDYRFPGDISERLKHFDVLRSRGLELN